MVFKIDLEAKQDIQREINYFNQQQKGLGKKFHKEVLNYFSAIKINPFYQVRYDEIRCLPLKKFPAMIHFSVDENAKIIIVRAVINTSKNPDTNWV